MTEITSNITFDNENGKITKCVLQIGGKTFTVTLVNSVYNVEEGGTAPCSTPGSANAAAKADGSANAAAKADGSANTAAKADGSSNLGSNSTPAPPAPSAPPAPLKQEEYNTQEDLITTQGSYGYTAPQ